MFLHRFYALPGWLIVGWLGMAGGAHASPLSFDDALALGVRNAPELSANTAQIKSAQELIEPADALPDPKLSLGVTNYPISGPQAGSLTESQMTMQRIGISQAIPNSAKRHARAEIAEAELSSAQVQRHVVRLIIQQQASQAWLKRYYLERKLEQLDTLDRENQLLTSTVDAIEAASYWQIAKSYFMPSDPNKRVGFHAVQRTPFLVRTLRTAESVSSC